MTYLTFKSYIRREFDRYLKDYYKGTKKYYKVMFRLSKDDYRLAVIAQCYFYTHKSIESGNSFEVFTNERYSSLDELIKSENKYADQYNTISNSKRKAKHPMIEKINNYIEQNDISISKLSKDTNMDRSNLHKVIKKGQHERLSTTKILTIFRHIKALQNSEIVSQKNISD